MPTQSEELTSVLKSVSLSLHSIKETLPSVISGHVVTPSTASRDRQRSASIFDAVGLALRPTEVDGEYHLPVEEQEKPEWNFDFNWPRQSVDDKVLERTSYEPVLTFLRGLGLLAEDVSEGSNCVEKLLYNSDIYSPRRENPKEVRGQQVYHRHRVQGRSDLVVLNKSRQGGEILRGMVRIAIEIKTTTGYRQSTDGCMFEAQLHSCNLLDSMRSTLNTAHLWYSPIWRRHILFYIWLTVMMGGVMLSRSINAPPFLRLSISLCKNLMKTRSRLSFHAR